MISCLHCGKPLEFGPKVPKTKKFCNYTCRNRYRKKTREKRTVVCPVCKTKWLTFQNGKYCSPPCAAKARKSRKSEARPIYKMKGCPWESGQVKQLPFGGIM